MLDSTACYRLILVGCVGWGGFGHNKQSNFQCVIKSFCRGADTCTCIQLTLSHARPMHGAEIRPFIHCNHSISKGIIRMYINSKFYSRSVVYNYYSLFLAVPKLEIT